MDLYERVPNKGLLVKGLFIATKLLNSLLAFAI